MTKVKKVNFDAVLTKLLTAKPEPRTDIVTSGKHGSKTPVLRKP